MIGILGGTFDPIHCGHIEPALEMRRGLMLSEIRFVLAGQPSHRATPSASAADRLAMLKLALLEREGCVADDRELRRAGPSYTVDTLRELRAERGKAQPLGLIVGADAFRGFTHWREWPMILNLANLIVAARPGSAPPVDGAAVALLRERGCRVPQDLKHHCCGAILWYSVHPVDISATAIRKTIAAGEDASAMLPRSVWRYIQEHRLYAAAPNKTTLSKLHDGY